MKNWLRKSASQFSSFKGLRRQASIRLLLVILAAIAAVVTVAYHNYGTILEREIAQKQAGLRYHYEQYLPRVDEQWRTEAERSRARIEFSRMLEEPDALRWAKFTAYINAQWQFLNFPNIIILGPGNQPLFRYGPVSQRLDTDHLLASAGWYYDPQAQELHRLFSMPIWLGKDGQGMLILLKTINHGVLSDLSAPSTQVQIRYQGRLVAEHLSRPVNPAEAPNADEPKLQIELPWPGSADSDIRIRVIQPLEQFLPLREFVTRPLMVVALIVVLIWLGLGLWLGRTTRRIEALKASALAYASRQGVDKATDSLTPALSHGDEVRDLALAMQDMMGQVESHHHEQQVYLETLSLLEEAVLELNDKGEIIRASPGWHKLVRDDQCVGKSIQTYIYPDDIDALHTQCKVLSSGEKTQAILRIRLQARAGEYERWVECRLICHQDSAGQTGGLRGVLRDITQTYLQEKQITHMALHDALTHLPNRVLLEDRINVALRMAARTSNRVGICFIDLDHFKNVNDALGHKAGDRILVAFADRLRENLRAGDTLARWGGDEFVLLLPDVDNEADIRDVTHKISQSMQTPINLDDTDFAITFSLGCAIFPDNAESAETLLSQADRAMFFAKSQGRNQVCFFSDISHKASGREELYIQNLLATAINSHRIEAWFQPIVSSNGQCCHALEVLARWHEPSLGWVSPATFIPMAENLGLIRELGDQIWLASLDACQRLKEQGLQLKVAINISKRQLFQHGFTETKLADLASRGLSPDDVILEVTESVALLDVENAGDRLVELKQAGFHLAIDDFGTGYASLSQLHEMPVDELKIDGSFVRRIGDPKGHSMIQAIVSLARSLGMQTIAEGVEDAATAESLEQLGVDSLQGFHFAWPMPWAEFERWLAVREGAAVRH